ncbi:MAG: pyridoxamine 5'-phosphate oxidase family protein [Pseudomonadota bacterium]
MTHINTVEQLVTLYGQPSEKSLGKVCTSLTPKYRTWIEAARFVVLSTVGPGGTDGSPRGDSGPVVRIVDDRTLLLPDWLGNNRLDSLKNIVVDGRVSLMFMIPGCSNTVRVNGTAVLSIAADVLASFERSGKTPRSVIAITINEIYFQCAKAIMRADIWSGQDFSHTVPTAGEFIAEYTEGLDVKDYDDGYAEYAKPKMW